MEQTTAKPKILVKPIGNTYQSWRNGKWVKITNFVFKRTAKANVYQMLNDQNRLSKPIIFGGLELIDDRRFSLKCASGGPYFFYGSKSELTAVWNFFLNQRTDKGVNCG